MLGAPPGTAASNSVKPVTYEVMTQAEALRARARKCRRFAAKYISDIGPSLGELAIELEKRADQIAAGSQLSDRQKVDDETRE